MRIPEAQLQRSCASGGELTECSRKNRFGLQTKLKMSVPGDIYEQEADRIADRVTATPAPTSVTGTRQQLQRLSPPPDTRDAAGAPSVGRILTGPGAPLDPALQQDMGQRFGHDFSRVRVYSDGEAGQSAVDMNANAYTVGHKIVFGTGRFAPATQEGRRLLAHELTHVVQQSAGPAFRASGAMLARQPAHGKAALAPVDLAHKLAKKLHDGKRDDVLNEIVALTPADRDALDLAAPGALPKDKAQADELRRMIRFARNPPASEAKGTPIKETKGTSVPKGAATVPGGTVELRTGVSAETVDENIGWSATEAYSLTYKGADTENMRWLQFAWREVIPKFPPKAKEAKPPKDSPQDRPLRKRIDHSGRPFYLTTDRTKPNWMTDSGTKKSAFYEQNTAANRTGDQLTMFDAPDSMIKAAKELLNGGAESVTSHFHASTYLIHRIDVLYRADIDLTWTFEDPKAAQPPVKVEAKGGPAKQIEAVQRASLVSQDPNVDYLPGPAIGAPQPVDKFDAVKDLSPTGSLTKDQWDKAGDVDRYGDVAKLAHAEWIHDVGESASISSIHTATDAKKDVIPGLNYSAKLPVQGETGFIDSKNVYHNPDLPVEPDGPLPRVATILGPSAFDQGKEYALATLRHEMTHAAHEQLAIGWLLKWRDERTATPFKGWLANQMTAKSPLSKADFAIVSAFLGDSLAATELPAYTEGFLTGLPFLPPQPAFQRMLAGKYPAAIAGLQGAWVRYGKDGSKDVRKATLDRVHDFSCEALTQSQRDSFAAWVAFLLDPDSLHPTTDVEKQTAKLIRTEFTPLKDFLNQVLTRVRARCTK